MLEVVFRSPWTFVGTAFLIAWTAVWVAWIVHTVRNPGSFRGDDSGPFRDDDR